MHSLVRQTAGIGFTGDSYEESFVLADVVTIGLFPVFRRRLAMNLSGLSRRAAAELEEQGNVLRTRKKQRKPE